MRFIKFFEVSIFICGLCWYFIGTHNIDNAYNMILIPSWEFDLLVNSEITDSNNLYLLGVKQLFGSLILFIAGLLLSLIGELKLSNTFKSLNAKS